MKKIALALTLAFPAFTQAASFALNFDRIPLVNFAQATYKVMLKRDYVISADLLALEKPISVSIRDIDEAALPALVERVLSSQGVESREQGGVYYLSPVASDRASTGGSVLPLSGKVDAPVAHRLATLATAPALPDSDDAAPRPARPNTPDAHEVLVPSHRKAEFVAAALNAVHRAKVAAVAGGLVVLYAPPDRIEALTALARSIDAAPHQVKVSATFVEVATNTSSGLGISVIADLLGARLGVKLGDTSSGSLSIRGNSFQLVLDALASDGRFKQVSNPTALADDGEKTSLSFGDSVPTIASTTLDKNGTPIQQIVYQQSGVLLDVTPHVLGSGKINLAVDGQVSSFSATSSGVTSSPTLSKRQVRTVLTVADGEVVVIGGLNGAKTVNNASGFSFLPASWSMRSDSSSSTDLVLILSASVVP